MFIGKICDNLIKTHEAPFAKSLLAVIVIVSPGVITIRTKSKLIEP